MNLRRGLAVSPPLVLVIYIVMTNKSVAMAFVLASPPLSCGGPSGSINNSSSNSSSSDGSI